MKLIYDATTLELPAPLRPVSREYQATQDSGRDSSGNLFVYNRGAQGITRHSLPLKLTAAQFDELKTFVLARLEGRRRAFSWIDEAGVSRTCRFATGSIGGESLGGEFVAARLELLELT